MKEAFEVPAEFLPSFQRALGIQMGVAEDGAGLAWVDVDVEKHWGRTAVHGGLFPALVDVAAGYFPLRTGDGVRFEAIDRATFDRLRGRRLGGT